MKARAASKAAKAFWADAGTPQEPEAKAETEPFYCPENMEWAFRPEIDALAKYFKSMNRILPHPDAWPQVKARVDRAVRRFRAAPTSRSSSGGSSSWTRC